MVETTCSKLLERARSKGAEPAYYAKKGRRWVGTTWAEHVAEVRQATRALVALGFQEGQVVCILGFNRPEWVVMDLAAMCAGGAPAGIYATNSPEEVQYVVSHSEAPVLLVEDYEQWQKVDQVRDRLPALRHVVLMRGAPTLDDAMCLSWEDFLHEGNSVPESLVDERINALELDGLATLIYTSGTTGPPKGVMLSHRNLAWTAGLAVELLRGDDDDCVLSYLPLSHIAEQMFTIHGSIAGGYAVYFAESIQRVPDNLKEVQPTVFFAVPRIWEKFQVGITEKLEDATGAKRSLANWAMSVAGAVMQCREAGQLPSHRLSVEYALAHKLVLSKIKHAIGLSRAKVMVSGAAPISADLVRFFARLDLLVQEVYGQSEGSGPTTFNFRDQFRIGTVGRALPGVDVKLGDDGEVLLRGPNVFLGYFKDEESTRKTLVDGWLNSGDLGAFDEDGFLSITGRKKDIIITAGGKNIAPKNIEGLLKKSPVIGEAVVIGDRRKYLAALIALDREAAEKLAPADKLNGTPLHEAEEVVQEVRRAVEATNEHFARVEQIKKFRILDRPFTIEGGELTPTLKVKRNVVNEHFADVIEALYAE
jgi:long-chain acyl-CoA synthetase